LFDIEFDDYFATSLPKLAETVAAGFVEINDDSVTVGDAGRLFVRNVCMAFDRYLEQKDKAKPTFSRTV
jgi:oxygen-independent coproporphyrinogen-3 oxidase